MCSSRDHHFYYHWYTETTTDAMMEDHCYTETTTDAMMEDHCYAETTTDVMMEIGRPLLHRDEH